MLAALALVLLSVPTKDLDRAQPWAKWTVGSWVTYDVKNTLMGPTTLKTSLTKSDDATFTLREESSGEDGATTKEVVLSLAHMGYPQALATARVIGEEELSVKGRAWPCKVYAAKFSEEGVDWEAIAWVTPEIDHPLRVSLRGHVHFELTAVDLSDRATVGQRKFEAIRYTGSVSYDGGKSTLEQWRSSDIPGGMLRTITTQEHDGIRIVHTMEVREFRGTRRR